MPTRALMYCSLFLVASSVYAGVDAQSASEPVADRSQAILNLIGTWTGNRDYWVTYHPRPFSDSRHKAFAVSQDLVHGYVFGASSRDNAMSQAVANCNASKQDWQRPCVVIDVDDQIQNVRWSLKPSSLIPPATSQAITVVFADNKGPQGYFQNTYSHQEGHRLFMRASDGSWRAWTGVVDLTRLGDVAAHWCSAITGGPNGCTVLDVDGTGLSKTANNLPFFKLDDPDRIDSITQHWAAAVGQFKHGYAYASGHKAFAYIYGQGAFLWDAGFATREEAEEHVLSKCRHDYGGAKGTCHLINVDGEWVD